MVLYLHKVAKMLNLSPKTLKRDVREGRLHLDGSGYVDCEEIKILYPLEWERAREDQQIEYYNAVKETCSNWKNGAKEFMANQEKNQLVRTIRKQEAEIYSLHKRVLELEAQLKEP